MLNQELDQARTEAFGGQLLGHMNGAALSLMIGIGHETGLFDTLASLLPATSEQVAEAAGLNERYVREWLAAMVCGHIVEYGAMGRTYRLPPEHAAFLTRAAGLNNFARFVGNVAAIAPVKDQVVACFRRGGGVPYSAFPTFQRMISEGSDEVMDARLIAAILPLVPGLPARLRAGMDVADVGCGSGHAVNLMAREYPRSRFTGYDFSEEGIGRARAEAVTWGLPNARFELQDVAALEDADTFDLVTAFDAIHDQAAPRRVLANIARALRPGGTFLLVEPSGASELQENVDNPLAAIFYTFSTLHCMTVSLAQDGEGLGSMYGEQMALQLLADAGFVVQDITRVEGDIANNYYICRSA